MLGINNNLNLRFNTNPLSKNDNKTFEISNLKDCVEDGNLMLYVDEKKYENCIFILLLSYY